MSVEAMTWAWSQDLPGLSKSVLVALANYADINGEHCFPGQKKLALKTGWSERAVRGALLDLEQRGLIARHHRQRTDGSRTSDEIALNLSSYRHDVPHGQPAGGAEPTGRWCRAINRQRIRQKTSHQEEGVVEGRDERGTG
jgi:hypothetical protein